MAKKKASRKAKSEPVVHYHTDGSVWAKGHAVGGVMTGYWEFFRKDGTRMRSGHFDNGEQSGEWKTYDQRGKVFRVTKIKPKGAKKPAKRNPAKKTPAKGKPQKTGRR
jgi:antitoxin component YwqK of YwqJK toxin-antitoxin module